MREYYISFNFISQKKPADESASKLFFSGERTTRVLLLGAMRITVKYETSHPSHNDHTARCHFATARRRLCCTRRPTTHHHPVHRSMAQIACMRRGWSLALVPQNITHVAAIQSRYNNYFGANY